MLAFTVFLMLGNAAKCNGLAQVVNSYCMKMRRISKLWTLLRKCIPMPKSEMNISHKPGPYSSKSLNTVSLYDSVYANSYRCIHYYLGVCLQLSFFSGLVSRYWDNITFPCGGSACDQD